MGFKKMKIFFGRRDKRRPAQACGPVDPRDKHPWADSVLVTNLTGAHVGFLVDHQRDLLLALSLEDARKFHGLQVNLLRAGKTLTGWVLYCFPDDTLKWTPDTPSRELLDDYIEDIVEAQFDRESREVRMSTGTLSFEDAAFMLCDMKPWVRPYVFEKVTRQLANKAAQDEDEKPHILAFLSALALACEVPRVTLMRKPRMVALIKGKAALPDSVLHVNV